MSDAEDEVMQESCSLEETKDEIAHFPGKRLEKRAVAAVLVHDKRCDQCRCTGNYPKCIPLIPTVA
jgi:hypothetical protein